MLNLQYGSPSLASAEIPGDGIAYTHLVRALYTGMLGSLPPKRIVEFWQTHPLHHHGIWKSGSDLLQWIWECRDTASLNWVTKVMQDAEPFCVSHGFDFPSLASRLHNRVNGTSCLSGSAILSSMRPLAHRLFQTTDPYRLAFELLPMLSKAHLPGAIHQCLPVKPVSGGPGMAVLFVLDQTYSGRWPCDYHFLGGMALKSAPRIFDLPAFREVAPVSDCREISEVLWEGEIVRKDGLILLDGVQVGESVRFLEYIATRGLDLSDHKVPDREVVLIRRDVKCDRRNRTVLHSGCVYGAPVFLSLLSLPEAEGAKANLGPIIADMHTAVLPGKSEINSLHMAVVEHSRKNPTLTYHLDSQALTYNGETLIKGVPASILRRAIIEHLAHGRKVFSYLEFKKDENQAADPLQGNFETNLSRLKSRLEARNACLQIQRVGRGKFGLVASGEFTYKESSS